MAPSARALKLLGDSAKNGSDLGTLCGASKDEVKIEKDVLDLVRKCARLIGQRLKADIAARL
jgi:hypothetical protein